MLSVNEQVEDALGVQRTELTAAIGARWLHRSGALSRDDIFAWDDLNRILQYGNLQPGQVRLVGGSQASQDLFQYGVAGGQRSYTRLVPQVAHAALTSGGTLVIDQLDLLNPWADRVARALASVFKTRVQANLYASLMGAPGFGAHKDSHDVFVVQGAGVKHWTVGDGESAVQVSMKVGDILYLPEATTHDVSTDAVGSLHITFAIPRLNLLEVLEWAVQVSGARADLQAPINVDATEEAAKLASEPRFDVQPEEVMGFVEAHVASSLPPSFFNFPYVGRELRGWETLVVKRTFVDAVPFDAEDEQRVLARVSTLGGTRVGDLVDNEESLTVISRLVQRGHLALAQP